MPRFIHAADVHLDSPLRKLEFSDGAPVEEIRGATRRALVNLVDTAIDRAVDFVVISGDVYDGDWRDHQTGLFFARQATRLTQANIPLFLIRGNHDAASVITRSIALPSNPGNLPMELGMKKPETVRLESVGAAIHGQSFSQRAETSNMAAGYPSPHADMFNVGMLHTSLTGAEGHEPYAPCQPQQLTELGYQYWALGHIHKRDEHQAEGDPPIVFSGNLQGRHVGETGAKGCILVEYDERGECTREFVPLDVVRWEVQHLSIADHVDFESVADAFERRLEAQLAEADDRLLVVRVRLGGEGKLHRDLLLQHEKYESHLRQLAFEMGQDRVWLESLRIRSSSPAEQRLDVGDGPLRAVAETLDELAAESLEAGFWKDEFDGLRRSLQLAEFPADPQRVIDEARDMLAAKLRGGGAD